MNCILRTSLGFQSGARSWAENFSASGQAGGKDLMAAFPSCPELGEDDPFPETCFLTLGGNYH